jgi:hypothetical protein
MLFEWGAFSSCSQDLEQDEEDGPFHMVIFAPFTVASSTHI